MREVLLCLWGREWGSYPIPISIISLFKSQTNSIPTYGDWMGVILCLFLHLYFYSNPKPVQFLFMGDGVGIILCFHLHFLFKSYYQPDNDILISLFGILPYSCLHLHFCSNPKPTHFFLWGVGNHNVSPSPLFVKSHYQPVQWQTYQPLSLLPILLSILAFIIPWQLNCYLWGQSTMATPINVSPLLVHRQKGVYSIHRQKEFTVTMMAKVWLH